MQVNELESILSLARAPWMIEKTFAERFAPIVLRRLASHGLEALHDFRAYHDEDDDGDNSPRETRYHGLNATMIGTYVPTHKVKTKSNQNVAIIPVTGTLTKRGELCSFGMRDYINEIGALNSNEDIDAIVLDIDSPGGTVDGTNEFGLAVKQSKKPVVSFGDNLTASAAYWVASQSKHIVGNKNNPTKFGSIGVLYVNENWSKWIEENIGSVEIMRAKQSKDKARVNVIEPLVDQYRDEVQTLLNDTADQFIKTVKKARGEKLKADTPGLFTGKTFNVDESITAGLIDSAGSMSDAINIAASLAKPTTTNSKNQNQKNMKLKVSSFFKRKAKKATAADEQQPAAQEDAAPQWNDQMIFNTDGSGDGAFCLHPDSEDNNRKFETKVDNNQGNEPPTDPNIKEDDFWNNVPIDNAGEDQGEGSDEEKKDEKKDAQPPQQSKEVARLTAENKRQAVTITKLEGEIKELKSKLEKKPAGHSTTVVSDSDNGHEYAGRKAETSWEKKAEQLKKRHKH